LIIYSNVVYNIKRIGNNKSKEKCFLNKLYSSHLQICWGGGYNKRRKIKTVIK